LDGRIESIDDGIATVLVDQIRFEVAGSDHAPGTVRVAIRPGRIRILPENSPNTMTGEVLKATYAGSHMEFKVATPAGELFVVSDVESEFNEGESVGIGFAKKGPVLLSS